MSRQREYDPPPHMAATAHDHDCPGCGARYLCYAPTHTSGPRRCGNKKEGCQ